MPRGLNFQIQRIHSSRATEHIESLLHIINACSVAKRGEIEVDFNIDDDYCNVSFTSKKPKRLWREIAASIRENRSEFEWLLARWIVVLEGKKGWDDYLLLAHLDPSVQTDGDSL